MQEGQLASIMFWANTFQILLGDPGETILFYSRLCPFTAGSSPPPESTNFLCPLLPLSILLPIAPQCHLSNDVFSLPTDLTPFICHSVLLIVHLLSCIWATCTAHFHFALVTYWTNVCRSGSLCNDGAKDSASQLDIEHMHQPLILRKLIPYL